MTGVTFVEGVDGESFRGCPGPPDPKRLQDHRDGPVREGPGWESAVE